jgi:hypothetical protein
MIQDLVETLDRSWHALSIHTGPNFAAHLLRFMDALRREPRIAAVLKELEREETESRNRIPEAERAASEALLAVVTSLERDMPGEHAHRDHRKRRMTIVRNA